MNKKKVDSAKDANGKLKMQMPWVEYLCKLTAAFEMDDGVNVEDPGESVDGKVTIKIHVMSYPKYLALRELLLQPGDVGGVQVTLEFVYDGPGEEEGSFLYRFAFAGNKYVRGVTLQPGFGGVPNLFTIMENDVIQFFDDNLSDYQGKVSFLPSDLYNELFNSSAFCHFNQIDKKANDDESVGVPLGEWP